MYENLPKYRFKLEKLGTNRWLATSLDLKYVGGEGHDAAEAIRNLIEEETEWIKLNQEYDEGRK